MEIGIITGASSGLGREFVRQASQRFQLDEIWAVARRKEKLAELESISGCRVRSVPLDLLDGDSFDEIGRMLSAEQPEVRLLINAAGFGRMGMSTDISRRDNDGMIDLNCRAAVDMSLAVLPYMKKGSRLINICSTAGFQPLPGLNTYAASKAFLLSWTKALHYELLLKGIHVTAVCPYWIRETEFIGKAKATNKITVKHFPLASKPKSVARWALIDSGMNMWVSSASPVAVFQRVVTKVFPNFIAVPVWDLLRRI